MMDADKEGHKKSKKPESPSQSPSLQAVSNDPMRRRAKAMLDAHEKDRRNSKESLDGMGASPQLRATALEMPQAVSATDRIAQLARIYCGFDLDQNHKVLPEDLMALSHEETHRKHATEWSAARNRELVERMDKNHDGTIDKEEFVTHFDEALEKETDVRFLEIAAAFMSCAVCKLGDDVFQQKEELTLISDVSSLVQNGATDAEQRKGRLLVMRGELLAASEEALQQKRTELEKEKREVAMSRAREGELSRLILESPSSSDNASSSAVDRELFLRIVYQAFDLDHSGVIEPQELFILGNQRSVLRQKSRVWTEDKNLKLMCKLDANLDNEVSEEEFVHHFGEELGLEPDPVFLTTILDFLTCVVNSHHEHIFSIRGSIEKANEVRELIQSAGQGYTRAAAQLDDLLATSEAAVKKKEAEIQRVLAGSPAMSPVLSPATKPASPPPAMPAMRLSPVPRLDLSKASPPSPRSSPDLSVERAAARKLATEKKAAEAAEEDSLRRKASPRASPRRGGASPRLAPVSPLLSARSSPPNSARGALRSTPRSARESLVALYGSEKEEPGPAVPAGALVFVGGKLVEPYRLNPVPRSIREAAVRQIFQRFDLDRDGELGLPELCNLRRSTNLEKGNWAFGRNAHLIEKLDADGSSRVDENEFAAYFGKCLPKALAAFEGSAEAFMEAAVQSEVDGPASEAEIGRLRLVFKSKAQRIGGRVTPRGESSRPNSRNF